MIDPTKVQFANAFDTLKNYTSTSGSIVVPVESYSAGQYRAYTTSLALDKVDASLEILSNFSTSATRYYLGSFVQVNIDANFLAQTRCYVTGSTLTVDLYVANQTGGVVSNTGFTLTTEVRRFLTPFS